MKAIILAAGRGKRLDSIRGDDPKCLIKIGGISLIERQLHALRIVGLHDIVVVVGFGADHVRQQCGPEITYIENERHDHTNSLFSLWLTRHLLSEGFVVLNADVLFHTQMLVDLIFAQREDALLISYQGFEIRSDEEMKVKVRQNQVVDISKQMDPVEADGENVGIVKFGPAGAALLIEQMDKLVAAGNEKAWAPRAFREFAVLRPLYAVSTSGYPWIEIDFPEDYSRALNEILPKLRVSDEHFIGVPSPPVPVLP
jgi:choline kinase